MAQDDPVAKALAGAKDALANANKFTKSVTGNATDAFHQKAPPKLNIPQAKEPHEANYGMAQEARSTAAALKAKSDNVDQVADASKQ